MGLQRITAPTLAIVTLAEMKAHLRVTHADEDALIGSLIDAAVAHLDGWYGVLGWCLGSQQWLLTYDTFPDGPIALPLGPLVTLDSVQYDDGVSPVLVTLPADEYVVDATNREAWLMPVTSWPTADGTNAVRVTFTVGHATLAEIHKAIPVAVKLIAAHWYENREGQSVPAAVDAVIGPLRRVRL